MRRCLRAKTPKRRSLGAGERDGGWCERGTRLVEATAQPLSHQNAPEGMTQCNSLYSLRSNGPPVPSGTPGRLSKLAYSETRSIQLIPR